MPSYPLSKNESLNRELTGTDGLMIFSDPNASPTTRSYANFLNDTAKNIGRINRLDWGNLPVGWTFYVGDIVSRVNVWYIAEKQHNKGGVGPDNDPSNWTQLNNYVGIYNSGSWYHAGAIAEYNSYLVLALMDVVPSDVAPDALGNRKWYTIRQTTQRDVYGFNKAMLKGTNGLTVIPDDQVGTITLRGSERDPSPRYRALVSNDIRKPTGKYSITYTNQKQISPVTIDTNFGGWTPTSPSVPNGFDKTKPNFYHDGGQGNRFNTSGVDFKNNNAGTTIRRMQIGIQVLDAPAGFILEMHCGGRLTFDTQRNNKTTLTFVGPIDSTVFVNYSDAPRSGVHDSIWFTYRHTGRSRITVNASFTYSLPYTGVLYPTQLIDNDSVHEDPATNIPAGLTVKNMARFNITNHDDHTGANDIYQKDKASITVNQNALEAPQDLRRVQITINKDHAAPSEDEGETVYLCTRVPGEIEPNILARATIKRGHQSNFLVATLDGVLKGQQFYILSNANLSQTHLTLIIKWDANWTDQDSHQVVVPGHIATHKEVYGGGAVSQWQVDYGDILPEQIESVTTERDAELVKKTIPISGYGPYEVNPFSLLKLSAVDGKANSVQFHLRNEEDTQDKTIDLRTVSTDYRTLYQT